MLSTILYSLNRGLVSIDHLAQATPAQISHLKNPVFVDRCGFTGKSADEHRVRILEATMRQVSLDPKSIARTMDDLDRGMVRLGFYGCASPVNLFQLTADSPLIDRLRTAVQENMQTRMFKAAQMHSVRKLRPTDTWSDRVIAAFRNQQPWPDSSDFAIDANAARARQDKCCAAVQAKRISLAAARSARMSTIERAANPGCGTGIYSMFISVALEALAPEQPSIGHPRHRIQEHRPDDQRTGERDTLRQGRSGC